jgi:hypothetical protein
MTHPAWLISKLIAVGWFIAAAAIMSAEVRMANVSKTRSKALTKKTSTTASPRRFRPLGLSLAIIGTALLYGVVPLLWALPSFTLWLRSMQTGRNSALDGIAGAAFQGGEIGTLTVILGVAILIATPFAWIGRPPRTRWLLIGLVWISTLLQLARIWGALSLNTGDGFAGGSLDQAIASVLTCQLPLIIVMPLYVTWYLNRAPARKFYGVEQ